jgi:hypothetical protein
MRLSDAMAAIYLGSTAAVAVLFALFVVSDYAQRAPIAVGVISAIAITTGSWIVFRNRARRRTPR